MDLYRLLASVGPGDLVALGALVVSAYAAIGTRKAATVDAFDRLCKALEERIKANDDEIAALKTELKALRSENETLRERLRVVEAENEELKRQLADLQRKRPAGRRKEA